ncbi:hypothetical protein PIROE2DRAFT_58577 [Piromyces sp. E2]|nr:hypothetical protein PIROE2DRAFT_58577 [Piromyces sp. E2]|eukprot:OUM67705.1 hypothetical protein PIROE2DRAFT_58577 [Piromyces sp. E2]
MYNELKLFLEKRLEGIYNNSREHSDENLLKYYSDQWHDYTMAMKTINHIFEYLNRNWIKREVSEGRTYIYDVYNLSLIIWKEKVFFNMKDLLIKCLLHLIEKQRHGEQIPEELVKNVIDSYTLLGEEKVDENNSKNPDIPKGVSSFKIYEIYYEKPFIEATEKFYKYESQKFINENSIVDYMKKKIRVPLNVTVRSEQHAENEETRKAIENDRSFLIQAAIVRIMKTRKTLKHVALMDEVISQLKNRFKPCVADIKKNIDYLLDKEYIERKEGEKDTYNYLA